MIIAAWFGLVTGLVEGILYIVFKRLEWQIGKMSVSQEIVWIAPLFDLILFSAIGLGLVALSLILSRRIVTLTAVFLFSMLAFLDWITLALLDRIHGAAIIFLSLGLAVQCTRVFLKREQQINLFWQRSLKWVAALVLALFIGVQGGTWLVERIATDNLPAATSGSPNVLVIVVDTLRADHLSSYGYNRDTSPRIDELARQGTVFENAIAPSAYTLPSHASLLTGRYTFEHGVEWDTPTAFFETDYPTIAEELRLHGYRTGAFSANLFWFTHIYGFGRGFIRFEDYFHSLEDMVFRTLYGRVIEKSILRRLGFENLAGRKLAEDVNQSFIKWAQEYDQKPFFAFLNYNDTHDPYLPPQPYRSMFSEYENPGGILNCTIGRCNISLTPEEEQGEIDAYDGAIRYVDDQLGELFEDLKRHDLARNTLIIITSDHGEAFGEHGMYLHDNSLYREVIHVPLIFWWPEHVPAGTRVSQPVSLTSLPATIMTLLGESEQTAFPGPELLGGEGVVNDNQDWPHPLGEMLHKPFASEEFPISHGSMRTVVTPDWHYIETENLGEEVYDWENDPREKNNLLEAPAFMEIEDKLRAELSRIYSAGTRFSSWKFFR